MFCLITLNHRQIQCQWGIHAGVALAIDIEMPPMIAEFNLTCEDSNKVPFNTEFVTNRRKFHKSGFGKTVFLTHPEAEEALARMKGE